ncbi:MAG: phage terminase large subunit family protein [Synergistaceae bacterium]|nr:phage terminase large subunit family protein [Synergistaceae bacterium]
MTEDESRVQQLFLNNNSVWLPPPDLKISQWADKFRRIPPEASAEPGQWRTSRAEYQREIMDAISDPLIERVVVMTAAQVGKTEFLLNVIGYFIDQEPSPILVLNPTLDMGLSFSKDRLAPMIRDTPVLSEKVKDPRSRDSGNTLMHKKFVGGHITIAATNSPVSLAARPIRILLCDEVDRYPISTGKEGDPLTLAIKRTQNFWNRRILEVSTPTLLQTSTIYKDFELSSKEEWCVPCPTCGEFNAFSWEQISYKDLPEPVMTCTKCGSVHNEVEWKAGQERGKWIAANPDEKKIRGFHMNAFASPWATWRGLVKDYHEALHKGEEGVKGWVNTALGLPYEATAGTIEIEALESHREEYNAELPDGVLVLTCGVDTQDDRLECEVVGWGVGHESWGIEYRVFYGDPGQNEVWQALDDFLLKTWQYSDGERLGIACVCIDSAGHFTDEVYKFCKPRARRNIFAIIGRGREGMPSVSKPSRSNRRHVALFTLGVNTIKGVLFSRLKIENRGAGYCHFPSDSKRGYDSVYFKGLLSERMVVKRVRGRDTITWETRSPGLRNEPLDTRVYATGAIELFNPNFEMHKLRRVKKNNKSVMPKLKLPKIENKQEQQEKIITEAVKPVMKRRVTSGTTGIIRRGMRF